MKHVGRVWRTSVLAACCMLSAVNWPGADTAYAQRTEQKETAKTEARDTKTIFAERKHLLDEVSGVTGIPWTYLAAIDQYERTLTIANPKKRQRLAELIGIYYSELDWAGFANPHQDDQNPMSIALFGGRGRDGSGDGIADRTNDRDVLSVMAGYLLAYGNDPDSLKLALWNYYRNERSVQRIEQFVRIYTAFDRIDLHEHAFPLPLGSNYSYRSTWGASRGWGGHRMHEGTDLFAGHGVPVRSTCYGIIEVKGWNPYGGWRVGLRDLNNVYHYYAHLSGFEKKLQQGDIVKPGQVLGWVGSSGYGKPGTQGKFPPHLHFGLYRDNGKTEWSFDPYAYLKKWEREERLRKQKPSGT